MPLPEPRIVPLLLLEWLIEPLPLVPVSSSFLVFSHPTIAAANAAASATDPILFNMTRILSRLPTYGIDETQDVIPQLKVRP